MKAPAVAKAQQQRVQPQVKLGSAPLSLQQLHGAKGRGNVYTGHVTGVRAYGAFVRFGDSVHTSVRDGLLHPNGQGSQDLNARVKQLKVGDQVRVWAKTVNVQERKVALCLV
jgi:predicted RNA-binding protein with RPS1 domain